jgi:uncharacterized protein
MTDAHMSLTAQPRNSCALAVMAKAPRAGEVKTRLVPPLTHAEAAALSACFLRDTAANVAATQGADSFVIYTPADAAAQFRSLLPAACRLLAQRGATLGARLINATEDLLAHGYASVCLINADAPTLPRAHLAAAVARLSQPGERVVLGPADDGGYYLIGLKRAERQLFTDITWSTAQVCAQTIARARAAGLPVELLPSWYDLDDAAALARLCVELFATTRGADGYAAPHTRAYLAGIIASEGSERIWPRMSEEAGDND